MLRLKKDKAIFVVRRVSGHSMIPVLPPGTLIIAIKTEKLKPGHIVVFKHDDKEKIKRISEIKDNQFYLLGDHHEASTDSRHFGWIDQQNIVAKVVWPRKISKRT